ncbi:MAG: glycosyltransferase family 9 protein [Alphaproteobacteria bacterium]
MNAKTERILVIKLGALGDFIQALGPMAAIRRHHAGAHITLLTTKPYEALAAASGYFNEIHIDTRPQFLEVGRWLDLMDYLRGQHFTRVYDLQNSQRTGFYFRLFPRKKRPEWVGVAKGASHRNGSPERVAGHAFDGHVQTLGLAGIENVKLDDMSWVKAHLTSFPLRRPYVLMIPGASPAHPGKRWPAHSYGRLAQIITADGYQPVIIGGESEREAAAAIYAECVEALDLTAQTSLLEIAALARNAAFCFGNDTGPTHIAAATGCPTLALFSPYSLIEKHAPKGAGARVLQTRDLQTLKPEKVLKFFKPRQPSAKSAGVLH